MNRAPPILSLFIFSVLSPFAAAQYTGIDLYPLITPSDYLARGGVNSAGQTVGSMWYAKGPEGEMRTHASVWTNAGDFVDLHPDQFGIPVSQVMSTDGKQQVGTINYVGRAILWSGSANSAVDLNPAGMDY